MPAHLAQPCCVALGWVLDLGLVSRLVFEGFVNWVPLPRLGPAVDRDGVRFDFIYHLAEVGFKPGLPRPRSNELDRWAMGPAICDG